MALQGACALYRADTNQDSDPHDTALRAAAWLTNSYASQLRAYPPTGSPGAQWQLWASHHARVVVHGAAAADDHPPDTTRSAVRQLNLRLLPVGRDGWKGAPQDVTVFVVLAKQRGQWRISDSRVG